MLTKKRESDEFLPVYIGKIRDASDPVFRTCEVLTRIDNLFGKDGSTPLNYDEKISILKSLRKGLVLSLSDTYLISRSQGDPNRYILDLIDQKIDELHVRKSASPRFPKIYDRKSWWR